MTKYTREVKYFRKIF